MSTWTRRLPHAKDISIRHLLVHGSGVIRDGSNRWGDDDFPDRETVRSGVRQQLSFAEPATTFRYSNIAYVLLGEVLEAVTGRPFEALLQRDVLGPLGTERQCAIPDCPACARRSRPATTIDGLARSRAGRGTPKHGPSGPQAASFPRCRICSTYQHAHFPGAGRLISDLSRREMQRTQWMRHEEPNHGLGWMIWHVDGITVRGHSGGYPGFTTKIGFSPEWGLAAAVLNNTNSACADLSRSTRCSTAWRGSPRWGDAAETARALASEPGPLSRATTAARSAR